MEIGRGRRPKKINVCSVSDIYVHDVNMYKTPPATDIHMSDFETLALERLKLLRIVENATVRSRTYTEAWKQQIYEDMLKEGLKDYYKLIKSPGFAMSHGDVERRTKDHVAHFILLLAYSQTDGNRHWFLQQEVDMFRLRFGNLTSEGVRKFIEANRLKYKPISNDEKTAVLDRLRDSTFCMSPVQVEFCDFYRVNFWEVPDLVRNMRVFMKAGFAYVPSNDLISVAMNVFRTTVNRHLTTSVFAFEEYVDDRIRPMLENLFKTYTGEDYGDAKDTGEVSAFMLDTLAQQSYPLCMRKTHEIMRKNSHLKYQARQQYQLFLKGIGLTMESCLRFFREEFTKKLDPNKFDKEYAYGIRHNYGKEGSRVNYAPRSCVTLINSSVGADEAHGCPFRHEDQGVLRRKLTEIGITATGANEIMDLVKNRHYQIACSKYFEFTHKNTPVTIVHPNQYFEDSRKIRSATGKDTPTNKKSDARPFPKVVRRVRTSSRATPSQSAEKVRTIADEISSSKPAENGRKTASDSPSDGMDWGDDSFDVAMLDGIDDI